MSNSCIIIPGVCDFLEKNVWKHRKEKEVELSLWIWFCSAEGENAWEMEFHWQIWQGKESLCVFGTVNSLPEMAKWVCSGAREPVKKLLLRGLHVCSGGSGVVVVWLSLVWDSGGHHYVGSWCFHCSRETDKHIFPFCCQRVPSPFQILATNWEEHPLKKKKKVYGQIMCFCDVNNLEDRNEVLPLVKI